MTLKIKAIEIQNKMLMYDAAEIADLKSCEHCGQLYERNYSPRILSCCGKTICQRCVQSIVNEAKESWFKCIICEKYSHIPVNGFTVNELALKLISKQPKEYFRCEEAEILEENLNDLHSLVQKLSSHATNSVQLIKEKCNKLRTKLRLARHLRIEEINQLFDTLVEKVDKYEANWIRQYQNINDPHKHTNDLITEVNNLIFE